MAAPAECVRCGRILPLGGVLDDVGRPVHAWCRGLAALDTAHAAQETARRIRRGGPVRPPARDRLRQEGVTPP